jgi:putative membrane protein
MTVAFTFLQLVSVAAAMLAVATTGTHASQSQPPPPPPGAASSLTSSFPGAGPRSTTSTITTTTAESQSQSLNNNNNSSSSSVTTLMSYEDQQQQMMMMTEEEEDSISLTLDNENEEQGDEGGDNIAQSASSWASNAQTSQQQPRHPPPEQVLQPQNEIERPQGQMQAQIHTQTQAHMQTQSSSKSFFRNQFSPSVVRNNHQSYFESAFSTGSNPDSEGDPVWQRHTALIHAILRDVDSLQLLHLDDDLTTPCHMVLRDKNYTRTWTHEDWEDYQAHALTRYCKHILSLPYSTTMRGVLPAVAVSAVYSFVVSMLMNAPTTQYKFAPFRFVIGPLSKLVKRVSISSSAMGMFVTPMGMLLALKANRAMDRLLEARREWGRMIRSVRTLSGLIMAHVTPTHPEMGFLMARYLTCFGWSFKALLRQENDTPLLTNMLPPAECHWITQQPHHPMAIICRIRFLLKEWLHDEHTLPSPMAADLHGELEGRLCDLEQVIGICNRIVTSPIPPTYTRHTSRVLSLFLFLLPLSLAGLGLSTMAVVFTSSVLTYIFAGIDEIGVEIEFPFWLLPMTNLATAAQKSVLGQITMMHSMPPTP